MKKKIILMLLMIAPLSVYAQFSLDFNTTNGYLSNQMSKESTLSSGISANDLSLSYEPESPLSLMIGYGLVDYFNFSERNYSTLYLGLGYTSYINKAEDASLNFILAGNLRTANEANSISDSRQLLTGAKIIKMLSETSVLNFSADFRYKSYNYLNELSFAESQISTSFTQSFETKTTVNAELLVNTKFYNNNTANLGVSGSGMKKNQLNSSSSQILYQIALAQNLFENTGLRLSYTGKNYLQDYDTYLDYVGFDFSGDGEFFDDPYSFENNLFSAKLTQVFPWELKLTGVYSYSDKVYNYLIPNAEGAYVDRDDKNYSYSISLERKFNFESSFFKNLNFKLDYESYRNQSTMPTMNYSGYYILLGIDIGI